MPLDYTNFLRDKLRSSFRVNKMFTDPSAGLQYKSYLFTYTIVPEYKPITEQAWNFAESFVASGRLSGVKTFHGKAFNETKQLIADAYVYSYMKAVWYGVSFSENKMGGIRTPQPSTLFYGHKQLYDTLVEGAIYTTDTTDNFQLVMQIDTEESILNDIISFPNVTEDVRYDGNSVYYNKKRGTIFSSNLESVLVQLLSNVEPIQLMDMNSETMTGSKSFGLNPLGNSCFSEDGERIIYIDTNEAYSSKISSFWGIANRIRLLSEQKIDENDSLYADFFIGSYYESNISFEVESITGYNPLNFGKENLNNWTAGGYKPSPKY